MTNTTLGGPLQRQNTNCRVLPNMRCRNRDAAQTKWLRDNTDSQGVGNGKTRQQYTSTRGGSFANLPTMSTMIPTTNDSVPVRTVWADDVDDHTRPLTGTKSRSRSISQCRDCQWWRPRISTLQLWLALAFIFALSPVSAVQISFSNCLSQEYRGTTPTLLQWVPLYADAVFDNKNASHQLKITMWGNVTGLRTNVTLPSPDSPDWRNPLKLDGKILDSPEPNAARPKLTTLHSKIDVLTYEPFTQDTEFCNSSLTNASCPLAPVFNTQNLTLPWDLPSVSMTKEFYSSYAFTSFSPTFLIIYGDSANTTIGCMSTTVTPDLGGLAWMLKFLPLVVLLSVGCATVFAGIFSPWGTTNIFHWTSNSGRHGDLLRLVTPGFGDCLQYIQFIALTGGLTLNYPGFYQPIVSQASWSALMFNQSFVSKQPGWPTLQDGIYYTNGSYGLQEVAQLVGMGNVEDIWAGMMVWLLVIIASITVATQLGFGAQRLHQAYHGSRGSDLRNKNFPFSVGNVVRIVANYFLLPIVALSTFQLVVASESPGFVVALAVVTLVVVLIFAGYLLYLILASRPRSFLFDDLPTLLLYGPLYNTYSDEAAAFALIPVLLTFIRGIAIGAVEATGITQIVILATCEVVQVITLHAFKPFSSPTSMNAYHTLFSVLRFTSLVLMIAFVPQAAITDGPKGWIGYTILLIHGGVLLLGFFLNAFQKSVEVVARMMGAGGDVDGSMSLVGGVARIMGHRQLKRRTSRRGRVSRASQSSNAGLTSEEADKPGYVSANGRRSPSAGSMGILMGGNNNRGHRSSSALDKTSVDMSAPPSRQFERMDSFGPGTPGGQASVYSFLPSPGPGVSRQLAAPSRAATNDTTAGDTFYRPPRKRRDTLDDLSTPGSQTRASWLGPDFAHQRSVSAAAGTTTDPEDLEAHRRNEPIQPAAPYNDASLALPAKTDYAHREVDYYYGVQRGERLNSDNLARRMGTGPADPTGPIASATGWFRSMLGGKRKDKGKGFEVVRSSRMPPAMRAATVDYDDEDPPEGTPVALGVLRKGPIESDDDDDIRGKKIPALRPRDSRNSVAMQGGNTTTASRRSSRARDSTQPQPLLSGIDASGDLGASKPFHHRHTSSSAVDSGTDDELAAPGVPRKSSRRKSETYTPVDLQPPNTNNPGVRPPARSPHRLSQQQQQQQQQPPSRAAPPSVSTRWMPFEQSGGANDKRSSMGSRRSSATGAGSDAEQSDGQTKRQSRMDRASVYGHVSKGSVTRLPSDERGKRAANAAEFVDD